MNENSLDELIRNLQMYELRRSSQVKEQIKRDQGLTLKALEDDSSNFDKEEIAITWRFKKFFNKAIESTKRKNISKPRSSDRE